jgi:FkbM family methyltransferase
MGLHFPLPLPSPPIKVVQLAQVQARVKNYTITHEQGQEFSDLKREIFGLGIYYFLSARPAPLIIDAGAHLGLATLYWKWLYPQAQILAFEPNPELAELFTQNMLQNNITNVQLETKALAKNSGKLSFYFDKTPWKWYSTGSLFPGAWNGQQRLQRTIKVEAVPLSHYLQALPVIDLLKLDIEGAEAELIYSLKPQLSKVQQLIFEWHPRQGNNCGQLLQFLRKKGFTLTLTNRRNQPVRRYNDRDLILIHAER